MKMIKKNLVFFTLFFSSALSFALPNPASVNCSDKGNEFVLIKETGICIFPDNTYCEEWAFYRGTCKQGQNAFPGGKFDKAKLSNYCINKTGTPPVVSVSLCNDSDSL